MILPPALRGEAYRVGHAQSRSARAGKVRSVTADQSRVRIRQVLERLGYEIRGTENLTVDSEVGIVGGLVQHLGGMVF